MGVLFAIFMSLTAFAEIDVEEQIRMAEDPNYLDYLREKDREEAAERAAGYEHSKTRAREEAAEERARREYVEWKSKQPIIDSTREEAADLKLKIQEEQEYLRLEKLHAEQKHREEIQTMIAQKKVFSMNRRPASVMAPRVLRKFRKFGGNTPVKLKKVVAP